jgi:prepilin-type N-terminal cleavage/methylation domain-containing protein
MQLTRYPGRSAGIGPSAGFTLVELMLVVALIAIITGVSVPSIQTAIAHSQLRGAASNLAGLMQASRMRAVKLNQTLSIQFDTLGGIPLAFVKNVADLHSAPTAQDPQVVLGTSTFRLAVPTEDPPPLTEAILSFTPLDFPDLVSFNPRGLPCKHASGVCTTAGFVYYLTDARQPKAWTAVSVSPGGRIKQWFWNGRVWAD